HDFGLTFTPPTEPPPDVLAAVTAVNAAEAAQLFNNVRAMECPLPPNDTCIPSNYPLDGCQARAESICGVFAAQQVTAGKAWIYDTGCIASCNFHNPPCQPFVFHVSPFLRMSDKDDLWIFDTAFSKTVLPSQEWLNRCHATRLFRTSAQ